MEKDREISLEAIQAKIFEQTQKCGGLWQENAIYRQIVSEVGELGDAMNKDDLTKPLKPGEAPPDMEMEIADIFYALTCFTLRKGCSLTDVVLRKIRINEERDKERFEKERRGKNERNSRSGKKMDCRN
ncbi:MAG TPA: MazG nucleotide pyrophosphohydrolase domain-containing protein [Patescibacteria group bacterium]|nr:MazG nucleotide pyrophosphohydrolase domain-containing protein [Patescibacteria group bacterium]